MGFGFGNTNVDSNCWGSVHHLGGCVVQRARWVTSSRPVFYKSPEVVGGGDSMRNRCGWLEQLLMMLTYVRRGRVILPRFSRRVYPDAN